MYACPLSSLITVMVLLSASYRDLRCREVPDSHWIAICAVAVFSSVSSGDLRDAPAIIVMYVMMSAFMFSERVRGYVSAVFLTASFLLALLLFMESGSPVWISSVVTFLSVLVLYYLGIIKGGADAKCLMSLSMAFPTYAGLPCTLWDLAIPEALVFNPVFSTLLMASLMSLTMMIPLFIRNLCDGSLSVSCRRMQIADARGSFVWPVEDFRDGSVVRISPDEDPGTIYDRLEEHGRSDVLVTPMIPFIVPITASFVTVAVLGSPLSLIL